MTPCNPTNFIISQAITSAVDGVLAKYRYEHQELLRGFIGTTARIFIQQQKLRTTQIFEEDDKDDVIRNTLFAKTNHDQHQLHEWEDSHDQVRDFIGAPIYDEYDYDSFREPRHNSEVTAKEGDMSSHINLLSPVDSPEINDDITKGTRLDRPIFTSDVESYYVAVTKLTDGPIYDVYDDGVFTESYYYKDTPCSDDDQVQGVNNGCNDQVLVDDAYIGVRKQYMNHGLGKKECHRQFHHEPPDRGRHNTTHTKLLDEISHILKLEHDQEDCLSEISVMERQSLEEKINYLRAALALETEKQKLGVQIGQYTQENSHVK